MVKVLEEEKKWLIEWAQEMLTTENTECTTPLALPATIVPEA